MKSVLDRWSPEQEVDAWSHALFVFDSSTLLNFYEFSNSARQDIYHNIFPLLLGRLWITNQTEYEFLKNREKVINRPEHLYKEIKEQHYPTKYLKDFLQRYEQLKNRTSKDNRHPYISADVFKGFNSMVEELIRQVSLLEEALNEQIGERLKEYSKDLSDDKLLSFFNVTPAYSYQQLMEIAREGEFRYRNKIPPGYADEKGKEEYGLAKFGDLIIWKEVIGLAKEHRKPIVMVVDDLKPDWYLTDKEHKSTPSGPRHELIKEMQDEGGVKFWSYSSAQFLYKARQILGSPIDIDVIEEVRAVSTRSNSIEQAVFNWAQSRFQADSTILARDFWADTGADIIQTLDGVAFAIQVKYIDRAVRLRDWSSDIRKLESLKREHFYESFALVFVADSEDLGQSLKRLVSDKFAGVEIYTGYIGSNGEFVEIVE